MSQNDIICSAGNLQRPLRKTALSLRFTFTQFSLFRFLLFLPRDAMRTGKRGICCRPVSVRPPSCHVRVLYPDGWRYRQTSFSARYHILIFDPMRRYPIPRGTPSVGASNTPEVGKICNFDWNRRLSRKRYEIGPLLLWKFNRKSKKVAGRAHWPW